MITRQSAQSILMVSPDSFGFDVETAESNAFQVKLAISPAEVTAQALAEFRRAVDKLRQADIDVTVFEGRPGDNRPDAVFPNNWISTWPDGRIFTYPMAAASRRSERDPKVLEQLFDTFLVSKVIDLSESEATDRYLEGTGAIVFDHLAKVAYGCISQRCDEDLFVTHVQALGYKPIVFHAYDKHGVPIYHTNVMMAVHSATAVICSEAITSLAERGRVLETLQQNHEIVDISFEQMNAFCGNLLEVENRRGDKFLVMSQTAYEAFDNNQRQFLAADKQLLPISIPTIEAVGGGSARCMLAEIFLPPTKANRDAIFDAPEESASSRDAELVH